MDSNWTPALAMAFSVSLPMPMPQSVFSAMMKAFLNFSCCTHLAMVCRTTPELEGPARKT